MRVTIFGATGMLGKALMRHWTGDEVTGLGSAQADIRSPDQVDKVVSESNPEWIVLSAAYTDVDGCEINPTLAAAVNTQGAANVAKAAANSSVTSSKVRPTPSRSTLRRSRRSQTRASG